MGWGRMMLFGNIGQQLDIQDLSGAIQQMESQIAQNQDQDQEQGRIIESLQRENRELKLYLATLIRLLVTKGVIKKEEMQTVVNVIEPKT